MLMAARMGAWSAATLKQRDLCMMNGCMDEPPWHHHHNMSSSFVIISGSANEQRKEKRKISSILLTSNASVLLAHATSASRDKSKVTSARHACGGRRAGFCLLNATNSD
jgi:hypothetical protein